ncbi:MAG: efflux RND transporter permease subunit [Roseitalea sp.]|nr:efflux RND transporter permease subunit [Roseitalea sp.]MBO6953098.1 efflux RND transporter permease subunit [Rhizobiaceae bacterium]MBO6593445.1 efflux RND transporter permease subunit [Roseitalea sp.]MBO6600565.1 efflux RND transporter permease subunit [Roseitalea sp.]MBO6612246.1 efflux RND transporter permease subunit [Roseitalea sp.]
MAPSGISQHRLVGAFLRHPNAANLLMVLMILFGVFALARINTQFFPTIETSTVSVSIAWSGASAEDVEQNILAVAEPELRFIENVKQVVSYAREGSASIRLEFEEGTDMQKAVADVDTAAKALTNLPEGSEDPKVTTSQWFDRVASISIGGDVSEAVVRDWAQRIRDDLVERGIDKVTFTGMRDPELQVTVPERELRRLDLTISDISRAIGANSRDLPSGNLDGAVERQLRTLSDAEDARALGQIEVKSFPTGEKVRLGDIAEVREGFEDGAIQGFSNTFPAIEIDVQSTATADTLTTNAILQDYVAEIRPQLPASLELQVYEVRADSLNERIMLLVKNGATGLLLVLIVLFAFLHVRIAVWVAAGIPVALLATVGLMYVFGETINMLSLFGLIMMLGVIVDDAIVVGEHTDTRLAMGDDPVTAAENGVGAMFTPVTAALTTTVATFAPLLLIGDTIGQIVGVLPVVVIAVAIASIVECFFILPGHLSHSLQGRSAPRWSHWRVFFVGLVIVLFMAAFFTRAGGEGGVAQSLPFIAAFDAWRQTVSPFMFGTVAAAVALIAAVLVEFVLYAVRVGFGRNRRTFDADEMPEDGWFRRNFDAGFNWIRQGPFAWLVRLAYNWRYVSMAIAVGLVMVFAWGLRAGEHVGFVFFPSPESENISGSIILHPGTPESEAIMAVREFENALRRAEASLTADNGEELIEAVFVTLGSSGRSQGDNLARIKVQLTISERRTIRTPEIVRAWRAEAPELPSVRRFAVRQSRGGPPGADIDVELRGSSIAVLKEAAVEVTAIVAAIPGVTGVEDDLPYGKPELIMTLTPRAAALGFTLDEVGTQVRNSVEGMVPRRFARGNDEVAIRVSQDMDGQGTAALRAMMLTAPSGDLVPLTEIVTLSEQQGFSAIQRQDGQTTISVTGEIDAAVNTTDGVVDQLVSSGALDAIARTYGIDYDFGGRSQEQRDAFADLGFGTLIALSVIYIILAWVFGSYFRPFAVMLIIPFGVVGAVVGHWLMGYQLTMLSMIGLLGLSGILVNDSIILVSRLEERLKTGEAIREACINASCDRFRAVLLTSLTTIGGLIPLLFETSLQAQFLMPMAITMVFGLATATVLVLFLVPVFIGIGEDIRNLLVALYGDRRRLPRPVAGQ